MPHWPHKSYKSDREINSTQMSVVQGVIHIPLCLKGSFPWFKLNFYLYFNASETRISLTINVYIYWYTHWFSAIFNVFNFQKSSYETDTVKAKIYI